MSLEKDVKIKEDSELKESEGMYLNEFLIQLIICIYIKSWKT